MTLEIGHTLITTEGKNPNPLAERLAQPFYSRKIETSILSNLHASNCFRLMFGQSLLTDDPGLESHKEAMLKSGCSEEELNLIINGHGLSTSISDHNVRE